MKERIEGRHKGENVLLHWHWQFLWFHQQYVGEVTVHFSLECTTHHSCNLVCWKSALPAPPALEDNVQKLKAKTPIRQHKLNKINSDINAIEYWIECEQLASDPSSQNYEAALLTLLHNPFWDFSDLLFACPINSLGGRRMYCWPLEKSG